MTLSASINIVAHATEDVPKILQKMNDVFSIPMEKILVSSAEGHWGNEISLIKADCDHKESNVLLEKIITGLKIGEKKYLLQSISKSFDEKDNFYIRLNKQSMCKGAISLSEHDSIRIRFKPIKEFNQNNKFKDHVINLFTRK
ncbi:MAG TPA: RNA-binding domain-containing protein [Nitrososphaeraceae archaeon]|nr:RNA-binding domain-containing protein [Nitrososphaeraceae archaeon]